MVELSGLDAPGPTEVDAQTSLGREGGNRDPGLHGELAA
jgi:hypothetical protein